MLVIISAEYIIKERINEIGTDPVVQQFHIW